MLDQLLAKLGPLEEELGPREGRVQGLLTAGPWQEPLRTSAAPGSLPEVWNQGLTLSPQISVGQVTSSTQWTDSNDEFDNAFRKQPCGFKKTKTFMV